MRVKNYLQRRFINLLTKHLFNTIDKDDILEVQGKNVAIQHGKRLSPDQIETIKSQSQHLQKSMIWKVLSNEIKYVANLRMYEKGRTGDDMLAGKLMLHILEIIERKLKEITQL